MPRLRRLPAIPFGWYYIEMRPASGRQLVTNAADLKMLLRLLHASLRKNGARLHAGSVTPDEVHLAVQSGERPVNEITRSFCHEYARQFNQLHSGCGSVFQSHPRILLLQHPLWLVRVAHVIHWIPRLRCASGKCCWSSDAAYRDRARRDGIVTYAILHLLTHGARNRDVQQAAYRDRFDGPPSTEDVRSSKRGSEDSRILGDEAFTREIRRTTGQQTPRRKKPNESADETLQRVAVTALERFFATYEAKLPARRAAAWQRIATLEQLRSHSRKAPLPLIRALIAAHAIDHGVATRAQVAKFFSCHPKTLSAQRRRHFELRLRKLLAQPAAGS